MVRLRFKRSRFGLYSSPMTRLEMLIDDVFNRKLDYTVSVVTAISMYLIGEKLWYGWVVALANQVLWGKLVYDRKLYGLAPLSALLSLIYLRALYLWLQS